MGNTQNIKYQNQLHLLNDVVYLALSCFKDLWLRLVKISKYTSIEQANKAFMGTSSTLIFYDGMVIIYIYILLLFMFSSI